MKTITLPVFIAVVIIIGAGSFYGGLVYGSRKSGGANNANFSQNRRPGGFQQGNFQARRSGANGNFVSGKIVKKDDTSLTLEMQAPETGSKLVLLTPGVQVMKTASGSLSDLAVDERVTVIGTSNQDGSLTAQSIQLRPEGSGPRGFGSGDGADRQVPGR